jgi:hypothetical protein
MFRHVEVNHSPSVVGKHDEDEQKSRRRSRDNEKVDRYEISNMLVQNVPHVGDERPARLV